jgi:hypothetical protein
VVVDTIALISTLDNNQAALDEIGGVQWIVALNELQW